MKTPTWGEIETFLRIDGDWKPTRSTKHDFYEKVLPGGEVLHTHVSHAKQKSMSPGTFRRILALQLKVSEEAFWEALSTRRPAARPTAAAPKLPRRPTLRMVHQLRSYVHLTDDQLRDMTFEEAQQKLKEFYSRER